MPFSPKDFPSSAELKRVQREHQFYRFYKSDVLDPNGTTDRAKFRLASFFENDKKKAEILDTALNLAPVIIDSATDFAFGRLPKVQVKDSYNGFEAVQAKVDAIIERNRLLHRFRDSCTLFQAAGHTHFKLYAQKGLAYIDEVPYSYWFPSYDGIPVGRDSENPRIVAYLSRTVDGIETKYIYVEDYYYEGEGDNRKVVIAKSLWLDQGMKVGTQVKLDTLPNLNTTGEADPDNPLTLIERTTFAFLPFESVDVRKNVMEREAESVLKKAEPLLYEVNDRLTQLSVQFLKHLNAKLMIPAGAAPFKKDGSLDSTKLDVLLAQQGEDAKYITNENPLIEQAFVHLEKVIRKIAKLTQTPDMFLTEDEKGGVEKASTLRARLFLFISRIERYQQIYEECIRRTLIKALKIEGQQDADTIPITVTFESSLPKDWEHDVSVWGDAKSLGLSSHRTAVGHFQDIDGDELEEELAEIESDAKKQQETMLKMMDAETPEEDPDAEDDEE